jgi:putative DNA primase/helicase
MSALGLDVWACTNAARLSQVVIPNSIKDVWIMADNDESGTGQKYAEVLKKRLLAEGRTVEIYMPETVGHDWLDELVSP